MDRTVRQGNLHPLVQRFDALVAAIFAKAEFAAVREPGERVGDLVPASSGQAKLDRETILEVADNVAFKTAEMFEINNNALADMADNGRASASPPAETSIVWQGNSRRSVSMYLPNNGIFKRACRRRSSWGDAAGISADCLADIIHQAPLVGGKLAEPG